MQYSSIFRRDLSIEREVFMKKKINKIFVIILCFITLVSALPMQTFAWTSSEGERASSREGEDYVGYDGEKYYYLKRLSHVIYDEDGNIDHNYEFTRRRPLDKYYLENDGKEVEAFCIEAGVAFGDSDEGYLSKSYKNYVSIDIWVDIKCSK